jgi:tetratricopeptide (TPR) repeat protein
MSSHYFVCHNVRAFSTDNEAWRLVAQLPAARGLLPTLLHNLAAVEMLTARYAEALDHEREAIRVWENTLLPDDPDLIRAWASLASLQYMMGRPRESRLSMEHALSAAVRAFGLANPLLADLLDSDAVILDRLKLKKQANSERRRARETRPRRLSPFIWMGVHQGQRPPLCHRARGRSCGSTGTWDGTAQCSSVGGPYFPLTLYTTPPKDSRPPVGVVP